MPAPRRSRPGAPAAALRAWAPETEPSGRGLLALQETLQERMRAAPGDAAAFARPPEGVDAVAWQFECLRQLVVDLGRVVPALRDVCTCPKMTADAYEFLCAAHEVATPCSAVDYTVHALDGATENFLNPTVIQRGRIAPAAGSLLKAVFRRVYRVVAHAYFHHKGLFAEMEDLQLPANFAALGREHQMMPEEMFIVPGPS